jgi:hypothetical protein
MISNILWIIIASFLGFGIAFTFAGWLRLPRNVYLLFYIPCVAGLFTLFIISNNIDLKKLIVHNWYLGLLGAGAASVVVIRNVLSQPPSEKQKGSALILDIIWPGFAYGLIDALLLSVLPILAVKTAFASSDWIIGWSGQIGLGGIALLASFIVTAVYHLGYPEYRGKKVIWAIFGNGILSLAYLLTMNPLAAVLPHIGMHITAMIHGRETTGQVPPHYTE